MDERNGLPEQGERLEFVPWSSYAQPSPPPWAPWLALLVVIAVAGLVMAAWGGRSSEPAEFAGPVASTDPAKAPAPTTPVTLLSEADLRVSASHLDDEVAAVAESFVFGYFTIDAQRSSGVAAELAAALGPLPEQASYVEWVRAEGVEEIEPDRFVVTVRFRLILLGAEIERIDDAVVQVAVDGANPGLAVTGPPTMLGLDPIQVIEGPGPGHEADVVAGPGGIPVLAQP